MKRSTDKYKSPGILLMLILLIVCMGVQPVFARKQTKVFIVKSKSITSYNQAIDGFRNQSPAKWAIVEYDMEGTVKNAAKMKRTLDREKPDLVVAVGAKAMAVLGQSKISQPIVYCMVMNPVEHNLHKTNTTGVSLTISPKKQLEVLTSLSPKIKRIGVLLRKQNRPKLLEDITVLAGNYNVKIIPIEIENEKQIPHKLRTALGKIDALWMLDDCFIHSKETLDFVIVKSLENDLAFMAISKIFVKEGALLSLSPSFFNNGQQASHLAKKILMDGKNPKAVPMSFHEDPELVINLKIARKIGLDVPPELLDKAKRLYE